MKLSAWVLVGLLLAGAVGGYVAWRRATEPARAWAEFLELEGVDVQALQGPPRQRAERLFERFAPDLGAKGYDRLWKPWMLLRGAPASAGESWVAVHFCPKIPAESFWLRVMVPRQEGELGRVHAQGIIGDLKELPATLGAGFRPEADSWTLQLSFAGADPTTSYYAWDGSALFLVRVEDGRGRFRSRDSTQIHEGGFGPRPPPPPETRWAEALNDPGPVPVLVALSWLAYRDEDGPLKSVAPILQRDDVRSSLGRLASSTNPWIREAAELALRP